MTTPRLRRLGLLGAGSILALVASTLAPLAAQAHPIPQSASDVTVTKTKLTAGPYTNGQIVQMNLKIENTSASPTAEVRIEDYYDYGLQYVSDDNVDCADVPRSASDFGRMLCVFGSIPGNTIINVVVTFQANYVGPTMYSFWRKSDERMEIQKAESHVSMLEDDVKTLTVSCEVGYHIMDFGLVKQHVDQDEGDYEHIRVISTDLVDARSYSVMLENTSTGQAQAKLYATCIKDTTNFGTNLFFSGPYEITETLNVQKPDDPRPLYAVCDPGWTPIAVDVRADKGTHTNNSDYTDGLLVQHGLEADGGERTRVWVELLQSSDVTLEWMCMKTETSSGRPMQFDTLITGSKTVGAGEKKRKKLECNPGFKGIIAGWTGGKINGTEPQPIARVFWFYNETPAARTYDLTLLCLRNRLMKNNRLEIDDTVKEKVINFASGVEDYNGTPTWIESSQTSANVKY